MFFAIFVEQACKKKLKTRCFLQFLTRFWAKKAKNTRFFAFFGQNVPAKNVLRLGRSPPKKTRLWFQIRWFLSLRGIVQDANLYWRTLNPKP